MNRTKLLRNFSTEAKLNTLIAGRWSSRTIDPERPVPFDVLMRLFEAARWAPSAMNNQPWRFLAFGDEDPAALDKARTVLKPGNSWALAAPRLLFILARLPRSDSDLPNIRAEYETGMAAAQMALQAAQEGLVFHQMAGFNGEMLISLFSLPEIFKPVTAAAVGYPGYIDNVDETRRQYETAERSRKPLSGLVFSNGTVPDS